MANIMDFWRNEWKSVGDFSLATDCAKLLDDDETGDTITKEYIIKAISVWFPKALMPKNIGFKHYSNDEVAGTSAIVGFSSKMYKGTSYLYVDTSKIANDFFRLFYSLGHELVHVSQYNVLQGTISPQRGSVEDMALRAIMDHYAYEFEYQLKKKPFVLETDEIDEWTELSTNYPSWVESLNWRSFEWTKWENNDPNEQYPQSTRFKYPI